MHVPQTHNPLKGVGPYHSLSPRTPLHLHLSLCRSWGSLTLPNCSELRSGGAVNRSGLTGTEVITGRGLDRPPSRGGAAGQSWRLLPGGTVGPGVGEGERAVFSPVYAVAASCLDAH